MLNSVCIMGRLCRDAELRYTQQGVAVCSISLAVERDRKNKGGERETDFFDVTAWGSTAEFVAKYFTKGRTAVVMGRLQVDSYEKDGQKHKSFKIVADSVYFGDSKPKDGATDAPLLGESLDFNPDDLPW